MRNVLRLLKFTLIILIASSVNSFALTEYYVDFENGSDDAKTCTDAGADECKTIQYALDTVTAQAGGSRINVEYDGATMTQTLAATCDVDTNTGTAANPIIIQGYSATVGDGTQAIIDGDSAAVYCFDVTQDYIVFKDLELKSSTNDSTFLNTTANRILIEGIKITSAADYGIYLQSGSSDVRILNTEVTGTTDAGMGGLGTPAFMIYNYIHDSSDEGIYLAAVNQLAMYNIIDTTVNHGISVAAAGVRATVGGNTVYNTTGAGNDNLQTDAGSDFSVAINNIFDTANTENMDINASLILGGFNCFHTNGGTSNSGTVILDLGGDQDGVDPGFEDPANGDFNLGANLDDDAYPQDGSGLWPGTVNAGTGTTQNNEIGAMSYEEEAVAAANPQVIMITKDVYYDRINKKFVYLNNILDSLYD